jgi:hypothetical protein
MSMAEMNIFKSLQVDRAYRPNPAILPAFRRFVPVLAGKHFLPPEPRILSIGLTGQVRQYYRHFAGSSRFLPVSIFTPEPRILYSE